MAKPLEQAVATPTHLLVADGTAAGSSIGQATISTVVGLMGLQSALDAKQAALVSGTNIKTVNGTSLLGPGDIAIRSAVLNVRDFGAVGDGTTDDTDAIQAALDEVDSVGGGTVIVPVGTYRTIASLQVGSNTRFAGEGRSSVILSLPGSNSDVIRNKDTANGNTGIVIEGLYCDGNRDEQTVPFSVITLVRCTRCIVRYNWATRGLRTGTYPTVSSRGEGIELIAGSHNSVIGNYCTDNSYDGIKARSEHHILIDGNHLYDNGKSGIQLAYPAGAYGIGTQGVDYIRSTGTLYYICTNNVISHSTGVPGPAAPNHTGGIYLHTASFGLVKGNHVYGTQQGVGSVGSTEHNRITDNVFIIRGASGIAGIQWDASNGMHNIAVGNTVIGMSGSSQSYVIDKGQYNTFRSNKFRLDGGDGTWSLTFQGQNGLYRGNDQSSASVSNTGINNVVETSDAPPSVSLATLSDGSTVSWSVSASPTAEITLGGNRALEITGAEAGGTYTLIVRQDGAGSRLLAWDSAVIWPGGASPTLSTTAGNFDVFRFVSNGTNLIGETVGLNYDGGDPAPTTGSTAFDSGTVDAIPSNWQTRWVTADTTWGRKSGNFLQVVKFINGRSLLQWNDITGADCEILTKIRTSTLPASGVVAGIAARASGATASETGYTACFTRDSSASYIRIFGYNNGTLFSPHLPTQYPFTIVVDTYYYIRFRLVGTALKMKMWAASGAEPGAWDIEITDSTIASAGWNGLFTFAPQTTDFDYVSWATGGGTAPAP